MEINLIADGDHTIAEVIARDIVVHNFQDSLDLIGNANYQGAGSIILQETHLHPDFFNLRTGLAGEILQKYANYRVRLAIIGRFEKYNSKSLQAFIAECNRGNAVFFVADREAALQKLAAA